MNEADWPKYKLLKTLFVLWLVSNLVGAAGLFIQFFILRHGIC